jgi:hypothetical protein
MLGQTLEMPDPERGEKRHQTPMNWLQPSDLA